MSVADSVASEDDESKDKVANLVPSELEVNLTDYERRYVELATYAAMPKRYICGRNYHQVNEHLKICKRLLFRGPKGVGKTTCLLVCWKFDCHKKILLSAGAMNKCTHRTVQLYMRKVYSDFPDKMFQDKQCFLNELDRYISEEQPTVYLDLSYMLSSASADDIISLIYLGNAASCCLIAVSSGMGTTFSNTASVDQLESALLGYQTVNFFPFSKPEAILFAKVKKGITDEVVLPLLKRLKPYTSYNPYLLTHALDKEVLTDSYTTCYWATVRYIKRTLPENEHDLLFVNHIESIAKYFYFAQQNVEVDNWGYKKSFVSVHNLTYVVNHNENTNQVRIKINFPLLPVILKEYLHTKLSNRSEQVNITTYPAVRGYMLEAHLFKWDRNNIDVTILLNDNPLPTVLKFPQVNQVNEVLDDIRKNTLYQLRSDHPIIDGIGFITNELGDYWLVFI